MTYYLPKNINSFFLKGIIEKDPHIYCALGNRKVYFSIDPRWITTRTAFDDFRSSTARKFSGLGIIKYVDSTIIIATPLVIGPPKNTWDYFREDISREQFNKTDFDGHPWEFEEKEEGNGPQ